MTIISSAQSVSESTVAIVLSESEECAAGRVKGGITVHVVINIPLERGQVDRLLTPQYKQRKESSRSKHWVEHESMCALRPK